MASFFGEIRPLSSRAVDDEEADNQPKYDVYLENYEEREKLNDTIKLIIFSVGEIASVFVKSHFLNDKSNLLCTVKYSCNLNDNDSTFYTGMLSNRNVKDVIAVSIFSSSSGVLICESTNSIPEDICHDVTELIFQNFTPSQMLILTAKHMATYKKEGPVSFEMPFLKRLSTSQYMKVYSSNISPLDSPNFLFNLPASLLLKCEITKLPATCVINYDDTDAIDSLNVHVFNDILKEAIVSNIPQNSDAKSKVIDNVKAKQLSESNLYI